MTSKRDAALEELLEHARTLLHFSRKLTAVEVQALRAIVDEASKPNPDMTLIDEHIRRARAQWRPLTSKGGR